jgi:hypothetical protein
MTLRMIDATEAMPRGNDRFAARGMHAALGATHERIG